MDEHELLYIDKKEKNDNQIQKMGAACGFDLLISFLFYCFYLTRLAYGQY